VNPDHEHPREKLAGFFWPDSEDIQARHSLRQALGGLRKVIPDSSGALRATKDSILLNSNLIEIDALLFDSALAEGSLNQLTRLYTGEFLEGCNPHTDMFEEWLAGYRSDYSEHAATTIEQRLHQLLTKQQFEQVIPLAMQLISIDPLREIAYRSLMQAYFELDNFAVALRWYRRCAHVLQQELGIPPSPETEAMHEKLLLTRDESDDGNPLPSFQLSANLRKEKNNRSDPSPLSTCNQRVLYQVEAAIEGILDHIGGQSLLIRGEADTGKQALATEVLNLAKSHGFTICHGRILADSGKAALREFTDQLTICLVSSATSLDKHQCATGCKTQLATRANDKKIDDITRQVKDAANTVPILLLVEDIHHANIETLNLLASIISTVGNSTALLVMTTRFEGEPLDPVWRGAMQGAPLTIIDLPKQTNQTE